MLRAWECAFAGGSAIYLSGPISGGPRFFDWYDRVGRTLRNDSAAYRKGLREHVVEPNSENIRRAAIRLRSETGEPVLEPASLVVSDWTQEDYRILWARVIERFVSQIILMPGWEFSSGCAAEVHRAFVENIPVSLLDGTSLTLSMAADILTGTAKDLKKRGVPLGGLLSSAEALEGLRNARRPYRKIEMEVAEANRKDASLDRLAEVINVAQFVSFSPGRTGLRQEYARIQSFQPNYRFKSTRHALGSLLQNSADGQINLRSFTPENPQSREFIYGLKVLDDAVAAAERLGSEGLFVIANETVDVHDGGVSGVIMGNVIEFAPDDTPRSVEKPGIASLPRLWGMKMLSIVYGFWPEIDVPRESRLEFSIHPKPRGWRNTHTLGWEYAIASDFDMKPKLTWPNRFSRMIGDKVYGLMIAQLAGLSVPRTTVINRRIAPFTFGRSTGSSEVWTRTSPHEQVPGKFTTAKGWLDPFELLNAEDPDGSQIASILCQSAVVPAYSGAAIVTADGDLLVEGVAGDGTAFMMGSSPPEDLPKNVLRAVEELHHRAAQSLGVVRLEWVFDGLSAWIVQLHRGATRSMANVLVPGEAERWIPFEAELGLEELRKAVALLAPGEGLVLRGEVGLTSHVADVIRRAGVPARLEH